MDDEIDDDALAAMMAEDEEALAPPPPVQTKCSFAEQADQLSSSELVELTCSLVDASTTKKKETTVRASDKDIDQLLKLSSSSKKNLLTAGSNSQSIINPSVYMDPTTHIRMETMSLTPNELKLKLSSTKFIRLRDVDKQGSTMPNEWCTMVVLVHKSEAKQASNGSSYSIWKITDFQTTLNMFLFGDAHQNLWKTTISSVLLIYDADAKKPGQFSIKSQRNVCLIGVNPDLGQCKAKAKSGDQCKNFIDRHACEYCVAHAHQHYKKDQNERKQFHSGNMSRMNLQSTGSFVPKKFAELGGMMMNTPANIPMKKTKQKESNKSEGNGWKEKERSMLVMLGIEDDPLICVRSTDTKGLGDSIADIREIYQAKQAAGKTKRMIFDETKDRDGMLMGSQIRSFPLAAPAPPSTSLSLPNSQSKNFVDLTKSATTDAINNAKQRAIDILKQRLAQKQVKLNEGQSLVLTERGLKRALPVSEVDSSPKRIKAMDNERFAEIMNMKSTHADLYSQMSLDEIFERYQKKENIEEKLLQVMERDIKVVVCRLCHYTAYKQSVLCKQKQHYVKINEVKQRFFECVECQHRVFTWSQYPVENCVKCRSLKGFRRTALIRERQGPKFDDEILLLRGEERTFLNSFVGYEKLPDVID